MQVIGKRMPMVDAIEKVTGSAKYAIDIELPNMLHGKLLLSPHPHAKILSINTKRAEELPGVYAVVTHRDMTDRKISYSPYLDQYIFAKDKVRFAGELVAAVAAVDALTARRAVSLIEVKYEPLPAVFNIQEAIKDTAPLVHDEYGSNIVHTLNYVRGDPDNAWKDCAVVAEETFETSIAHPAYLEPQACVAAFDAHGVVDIYAGTQSPAGAIREKVSESVGIPIGNIQIHQAFVGGGFGGKAWQQIVPVTVALAKKAGKPVKVVLSRREDLITTPPRVPMHLHLKMGADKEGRILVKETQITADNGAYCVNAPVVVDTAATRVESLYRFHNIKTTASLVYTNKIPTGTYRGFGNPQGTLMVECVMDMLAEKLHMDPTQIRLVNATQPGDVSLNGWKMGSCELSQCIEKAKALSHWEEHKANKRFGHGIGIGCCIHVNGNRSVYPQFDGSSASIRLNDDGDAVVVCSDGDIGQGASTVFTQIAAEELGLSAERVHVKRVNTNYSDFAFGAFASRITLNAGNAVRDAARKLKCMLLETASRISGYAADDITIQNGVFRASNWQATIRDVTMEYLYEHGGLFPKAEGFFMPKDVVVADKKTKYGNISPAYSFGAHVAEVNIDPKTGKVHLVNYVAVHDTGTVINPMLAEGQIEGGVVQGIGYALYEDYHFDDNGNVLNSSFLDYKLPTILDVPQITCDFADSFEPNGPFGAKGVGEPSIVPVAPAIANAIYDAIGVRVTRMPFTAERIKRAVDGMDK